MINSKSIDALSKSLKSFTAEISMYHIEREYISTKEVAIYLNRKSPSTARLYTFGAKKRGTQYFIPDVAENMIMKGYEK